MVGWGLAGKAGGAGEERPWGELVGGADEKECSFQMFGGVVGRMESWRWIMWLILHVLYLTWKMVIHNWKCLCVKCRCPVF